MPGISDDSFVLSHLHFAEPRTHIIRREVWLYDEADWRGLNRALKEINWSWNGAMDVDAAAIRLTDTILQAARSFIPVEQRRAACPSHPWINERIPRAVEYKKNLFGTNLYGGQLKMQSYNYGGI